LSYIATVTYKNNILPNELLNFVIYFPDSSTQLLQGKTDIKGKILLDGLIFEGSTKMSYKAASKKFMLMNCV